MLRVAGLAAVLVVLVGACAGGGGKGPVARASSAPTAAPTPTPSRPAPALVQVENSPDGRPQSGIQKADIVYEYLTEGGITRFSVIYLNPSGGERIEPVRSARLVTLRLLSAYQAVLFYSGASDHVLAKIYGGGFPNFDEKADGGQYYVRDPSRQAPHNLYTTGAQLRPGWRNRAGGSPTCSPRRVSRPARVTRPGASASPRPTPTAWLTSTQTPIAPTPPARRRGR